MADPVIIDLAVATNIVDIEACAIVNAANPALLGGGGVDGIIHAACGPILREECRDIPEVLPGVRCCPGDAYITGSGNLETVDWVIHTVGPIITRQGDIRPGEIVTDTQGALKTLTRCWMSVLGLANGVGCKHIVVPAVSCGIYGVPHEVCASSLNRGVFLFGDGSSVERITVAVWDPADVPAWEHLTKRL